MEPIISPWFIYFLSVVNSLQVVCAIVGIIGVILWIIFMGVAWSNLAEYGKDDDDYKRFRRLAKPILPVWIITLFLAIFVPTKNTLIGMYVADKLTYDIAEKIIDAGKDVKNELKKDVIDIIESITKDKDVAGGK